MKWKEASLLGIGGAVCLMCAWMALQGMFASSEKLIEMGDKIGTKNPVVARIICWLGFIPLLLGGITLLVLAGCLAAGVIG